MIQLEVKFSTGETLLWQAWEAQTPVHCDRQVSNVATFREANILFGATNLWGLGGQPAPVLLFK
jgi:hypothetical protein